MAVLFAAIYTEPAAWLEFNEYLLNDWPHPCFLTSLFPLPQFLPLFTVYPIITSVFLKTISYPLLYKVGYKKIHKKKRTNNEPLGASVTQAAYTTWFCFPVPSPCRGRPGCAGAEDAVSEVQLVLKRPSCQAAP